MTRNDRILKCLTTTFNPLFLDIENESYKHRADIGAESHFKIILVSDIFQGMRLIARHQQINTLLKEEFNHGLHALSLYLYTAEEWEKKGGTIPKSPPCRGSKIEKL